MATSTQLKLVASNPSAMSRYRLTGRLPEGLKPESPLITLLESIPSRDLLAIRGVVVDERLGYKGSRTFNTAGEALRWVKPSQVVFGSFPAESWRLKSFRPPLSMKSLCECSSQFPDHLLRHSGAPACKPPTLVSQTVNFAASALGLAPSRARRCGLMPACSKFELALLFTL